MTTTTTTTTTTVALTGTHPPKPVLVFFEEIDALYHKGGNKDNIPLIDVREPSETAKGVIPGSHLIPLATLEGALALPDQEFEDRYGFKKFGLQDEVIFTCRSGRRSGLAFDLAQKLGYRGVRNYSGSWIDYEIKIKEQQQQA